MTIFIGNSSVEGKDGATISRNTGVADWANFYPLGACLFNGELNAAGCPVSSLDSNGVLSLFQRDVVPNLGKDIFSVIPLLLG